ncbi:O-antigen ligase family protein [Spiribacter roseus]|uniref:O-antigen ligase family protein n=1 Tax=Spiribacter roseus TaxID=1855875 RepID=UPI00132F81B4|nr:O-antigen ligase family protein [Spiribacter roseus]KAF0281246.1 O-antigen polymerase [Spiribacter roseus]
MTLERAVIAGVLALLVWLPLPLASNRPWSAALLVMAVGGLLLLWGLQVLRDRSPRRWRGLRTGGVGLALLIAAQAWVAVQIATGLTRDSGASVEYLALGLAYTGLFALLVGVFTTRKRLNWLLGVLVVSGTLQAFYGALMVLTDLQWLQIGPDSGGVVSGTFVNRNHLAGYLEMTLACGIGLMLALREDRDFRWHHLAELLIGPKARIRLALIIMVIALVMSHSRMGNTAFFSSLIVMGGLFTLVTPTHRTRNALILVSVLVIDVLVISQWFGLEELQQRLADTRFEDEVALVEQADGATREVVVRRENVDRDDVAVYAWPQLLERPWQGYGAGSFETTFQRFPGRDVTGLFDHAHNDFLQFAIEYGGVGVLPLAGFVVFAFYRALTPVWQRRSLYRSGVGVGAAMGILALMIHSAADFNLQIPANAATFVTLCAIAVLANAHHRGNRRRARVAGDDGSA